jgi:hypothetical protein
MKFTRHFETRFQMAILFLMLLLQAIASSFLRAQTPAPAPAETENPPQEAQGSGDLTQSPGLSLATTSPPPATQDTSVVENVSTNPSWTMQNLLAKGSPLHFGILAEEQYDDNIFIAPKKVGDFVTVVSPYIDFEKGDKTAPNAAYLNLYFSPTVFLYEKNTAQDREDYNADLYAQYQWTRLTVGLEQRWQQITDADIDIGNFAKRNIYTTNLSGNYIYNDDLIFYGTATQRITSYETNSNVSTNEWIVDGYALYQVAPKLALGGGPKIGFIDILGAPNESYQDLLLHLTYNPEGKISVTFAGGMKYLQNQADAVPSHLFPIFDFSANYTPRDGTILSLSGSRDTNPSYSEVGQDILYTTFQGSIKQRCIQDVYLTLSGSYTIADYEFGLNTIGTNRDDKYFTAFVGAEWDPRSWLKFGLNYERFQDDSNIQQNTFKDNKISIYTSVNF